MSMYIDQEIWASTGAPLRTNMNTALRYDSIEKEKAFCCQPRHSIREWLRIKRQPQCVCYH